jgi:hypothetical protein
MTLTRFIMMYIYSPVALWVTRARAARGVDNSKRATASLGGFASLVLLPIVVTMALAGIWHGAGAQFVVFGLLHAVYLSVNHAWRILRPHRAPPHVTAHVGSVLLTYLCVLIGMVFFRAASVSAAVDMLVSMMGAHGMGATIPVSEWLFHSFRDAGVLLDANATIHPMRWQDVLHAIQTLAWLASLYGIVWFMPNTQQIFAAHAPVLEAIKPGKMALLRWQNNLPWAIVFGCAATLGLLSVGGTAEFLYFQF